jgi:hypothetical protein
MRYPSHLSLQQQQLCYDTVDTGEQFMICQLFNSVFYIPVVCLHLLCRMILTQFSTSLSSVYICCVE